MTAADWAVLVPSIVALTGAAAAWLRADAAHMAVRAHQASHLHAPPVPPPPAGGAGRAG